MMNNEKVSKGTADNRGMAALSKSYLVLYNSVQTAGWSYILFKTLKFLLVNQAVSGLWDDCSKSVTIFQSLAALEVLHCIVGIVPSSAFVTFLQVFSRVFMVWGIVRPIETVQNCPTLPLTLIAWGITEVVRYSYYCANLLGTPPKPLTWCRYTLFMGLYPAGVSGEVGNMLYALNTIKKAHMFSVALPNRYNISFSYYYFCLVLMASYAPVFPQLFGHMLRQRKKILGTSSKESSKQR
ncbi:very-long-chain (3R)-3-hydroxyacyl-CoA dehydratase 1-like [Argiope bruennichi]|uniref:very-long-chain (3R)-3-hydroxyacyl-CoA dehydratase 1-like n=1 Tax=Argiope bruennichi TaxID=94029 RepID=UPI00249475AD|nr:very-long-chain (3R)-3-hydroxyacyl-CoA dehydratase 1-like [Argiope bruennichi]